MFSLLYVRLGRTNVPSEISTRGSAGPMCAQKIERLGRTNVPTIFLNARFGRTDVGPLVRTHAGAREPPYGQKNIINKLAIVFCAQAEFGVCLAPTRRLFCVCGRRPDLFGPARFNK